MKKAIFNIFVIFLSSYAVPQEMNVNQKQGVIQNIKQRHIAFQNFKIFQPDLNKVALSRITKIVVQKEKVFILDERQCRIFVFDKQANYLYSIGRPGQGPGDLEYPADFFISEDDIVYVISPMANRIEVFRLNGDIIKRIELDVPKEIYYSHACQILVDQNQNLYVSYYLSSHLVDIYDNQGKYLKTLLEREDQIYIPGENIGNSSQIVFCPKSNTIIHFNCLTGVFKKISMTGKVERVFSAFDELQSNEASKVMRETIRSNKENTSGVQIKDFQLWSNCCFDKEANLYVFLLLNKKEEPQKIFVFSPEGNFLYRENIPHFINTRVDSLYCFEDIFMFITMDNEIVSAIKEDKK